LSPTIASKTFERLFSEDSFSEVGNNLSATKKKQDTMRRSVMVPKEAYVQNATQAACPLQIKTDDPEVV
jgi:hypothetical protein